MWGRLENKYYLISECKTYVCTIEMTKATFWIMKPVWTKMAEWMIEEIKMFDKGIKVGICKIVLEREQSNWGADLEIRRGYRGSWTTKTEEEIKQLEKNWSNLL
ncbi:hypothetical protein D3C71_1023440 [compost metagenome]